MATDKAQRDRALQQARIDELRQLLAAIHSGEDAKTAIKARLETLYPADYRAYCQRWRNVPGDHAPGRMLEFHQWETLTAELVAQTNHPETNDRVQLLQRALLLT